MKSYILTICIGNEVMVITMDAPHINLAYHFFSAGCQSAVEGFGDAKSSKLYKLFEAGGGVMEYTRNDIKVQIELEIQ